MIPIFVLALVQTAPDIAPPPPAYTVSAMPDGGFRLTVARLAADKLDTVRSMLDEAAAAKCGAKAVVPGDESYDQPTDADGKPASDITNLNETFKCA